MTRLDLNAHLLPMLLATVAVSTFVLAYVFEFHLEGHLIFETDNNNGYPPTGHWHHIFAATAVSVIASLYPILTLIKRQKKQQALSTDYADREQIYQLLIEKHADLVVKVDAGGRFQFVSQTYCDTFGKKEEELIGKDFMPLVHEDDRENTEKAMQTLQAPPYSVYLELRALTRAGWRWFGWMDTAVLDDNKNLVSIVGVGRDITEKKKSEIALKKMATYDSLTGLYNRKALETRLVNEVDRCSRYKNIFTIFMIDIDHFKQINDSYGHQAGDTVLRTFAELLNNLIRKADYVGRFGGEEFIVVLPETPLNEAGETAERLRKRIADHTFMTDDADRLHITASIGVASYPDNAESWIDLLRVADEFMYKAKKSGRNKVVSS